MVSASFVLTTDLVRCRLSRLMQEAWKYFLASIASLVLDYGLLVALTEVFNLHYLVSAAIGFCAGSVCSYLLSVKFVFRARNFTSRPTELIWFCIIGLIGLGLNECAIAFFVSDAGVTYIQAKIPTAALSFLFNFGVRRWFLFSGKEPLASL